MSNIAILIDAENVLPVFAEQIFARAAAVGTPVAREIYGAAQALSAWVEPVLKYALHPNLTIRASKGKNSSDIALVIGAMDLLLQGNTDTVLIASSDSDFSTLSVRLRSAGLKVIGMGTEKANPLWRTACSSFTVLQEPAAPKKDPKPQPGRQPQPAQPKQTQNPQPARQAQPKQEPPQPKNAVSTHPQRIAVIRDVILAQLEAGGGKVQSTALFTALNALPEYKLDQQRSGRKPLSYLMRQFGDVIRTEESSEGVTVFLPASGAPAAETSAETSAEAPAEAVAPETTAAETPAPGTPEPVPAAQPEAGDTAIAAIGLAPRPVHALLSQGYRTVADLAGLSKEQLMSIKGIGETSASQIIEAVRARKRA